MSGGCRVRSVGGEVNDSHWKAGFRGGRVHTEKFGNKGDDMVTLYSGE